MIIASKFGIGQQVRHKLLGYLGVIVDIDVEYSLDQPKRMTLHPMLLCVPLLGITL